MAVGNRRAETNEHSILKHLVASILEKDGQKAHIECECPDGSIIDVFGQKKKVRGKSYPTGIAYEIQTKVQPEIERIKLEKYMNYVMVDDVMFIYTKDFPISMKCDKLYRLLKLKIIG